MDCKNNGKFEDFSVCSMPNNGHSQIKSETDLLITKLQIMMTHASQNDRCTLCRAVEELEKKDKSTGWNVLPLVFLALFDMGDGFGGHGMEDAMRAYLSAVGKAKESDGGGDTDAD